jgi:hypothetical protein
LLAHGHPDWLERYGTDDRFTRKSGHSDKVRNARLSRLCTSLGLYGCKTAVYQCSPT